MPKFKIRYQGSITLQAGSEQEALEQFDNLSAAEKGKLYNIKAWNILQTQYAGEIEANHLIALCYKGILIFHVVRDYDSGPDFWSIHPDRYSWTEDEIDEERNLDNQILITIPAPDHFRAEPPQYISLHLQSQEDQRCTDLCWLIEQELTKPEEQQRCRHPYPIIRFFNCDNGQE